MCEFLIFNTQKRYEKQKNFGNFLEIQQLFGNFLEIQQLFGNFLKKIATFWQLLDTFIGNFFGIHRQLVAKPRPYDRKYKVLLGACAASCSFTLVQRTFERSVCATLVHS